MNTNLFTLRSSLGLAAALIGLSTGCAVPTDEIAEADSVGEAAQAITYGGRLSLVRERKLSSLFGGVSADYEASGVQVLGSDLYVVFDDMNQIAKIPTSLAAGTATYTPGTLSSSTDQYRGSPSTPTGPSTSTSLKRSPGQDRPARRRGQRPGRRVPIDGRELQRLQQGVRGYRLGASEQRRLPPRPLRSRQLRRYDRHLDPGDDQVLRQTGSSWTVDSTISLCGNTSCTTGIFSDYSDIALLPFPTARTRWPSPPRSRGSSGLAISAPRAGPSPPPARSTITRAAAIATSKGSRSSPRPASRWLLTSTRAARLDAMTRMSRCTSSTSPELTALYGTGCPVATVTGRQQGTEPRSRAARHSLPLALVGVQRAARSVGAVGGREGRPRCPSRRSGPRTNLSRSLRPSRSLAARGRIP